VEGYIVAVCGVTRASGIHIMGEVRFGNRITRGNYTASKSLQKE
jgi:hypothetical protein